MSYLLTPAGIAEKARMSRESLKYSLRFYTEARERISGQFAQLSADWPCDSSEKRIVFFGTGEVAEIGYVCLQETDLRLTSVFDDERRKPFFGVDVLPTHALREVRWDADHGFSALVVMAFADLPAVSPAVVTTAG